MRDNNHRRSSNKIWAQEERLFLQKGVIFPSFSSVTMKFFLTNQTNFFIDPLHQKKQKPDVGSCQSTKIDNFSRSDPLKV